MQQPSPAQRIMKLQALFLAIGLAGLTACGGGGGGGGGDGSTPTSAAPSPSPTSAPSPAPAPAPASPAPVGHITWTAPQNEKLFDLEWSNCSGDSECRNGSHVVSNDGRYVFFATIQQDSSANAPGYFNVYRADTTTGAVSRFFDWSVGIGTTYAAFHGNALVAGAALNGYVSPDGHSVVFETTFEDANTATTGIGYGPYFVVTTDSAASSPHTSTVLAIDEFILQSSVSRDGKLFVVTTAASTDSSDKQNIRLYANGQWSQSIPTGVELGPPVIAWDNRAVFFPLAGLVLDVSTLTTSAAPLIPPSFASRVPPGIGTYTTLSNGSGFNFGDAYYDKLTSNSPIQLSQIDPSALSVTGLPALQSQIGLIADLAGTSLAVLTEFERIGGIADPNGYLVDLSTNKLVATLPLFTERFGTGLSENGAYVAQQCGMSTLTICINVFPTGASQAATTGSLTLP